MESMEKKNETEVVETPAEIKTAEDSKEKLFTQEQVNEIIKKRLGRQKEEETDEQELKAREKELTARESKLSCKEYLIEKGYPAELLDVIDTSDVETFKNKADKANNVYFRMQQAQNVAPLANLDNSNYDAVASAFVDTKHEPKQYGR